MLIVVVFGPPGSGKGTQSQKIIEKYKLAHLSTGDLLRAEINSGSALGVEIGNLINSGNFVPDDMVQEMVENFILVHAAGNGFILDGFPRTVKQAVWLDEILKKINAEVSMLLRLMVDDDELRYRLSDRGKNSGRVDDQKVATINNRIEVYHRRTEPVAEFYKSQSKYQMVEGVGMLEEVFGRICDVIDKASR